MFAGLFSCKVHAHSWCTYIFYNWQVGTATSIGEQPLKMLVSPEAGARMSVAEMLTNMAGALISDLKARSIQLEFSVLDVFLIESSDITFLSYLFYHQDIKCSGNWMWPAKVGNEGANLLFACRSMCEVMKKLGIAIDGGKDSLSMAARDRRGETILSPGTSKSTIFFPLETATQASKFY